MDGLTLPLVDDAALHDQIGTGHHGDALQRITVKGHQVGILAGLQRTDVLLHAQQFRSVDGGTAQRLHGSEAVFHQIAEFPGLFAVFIAGAAGIGTDFRLGQRSLTELTRDGVLRDLDPLILDAVVLGTANQLLCLHFAGHLALDDAAIRAALDACWHAIAAAPRLTE